jgi:hypothetical protein
MQMIEIGLSWGKATAKDLAYECVTVNGERVIQPAPSSRWESDFNPFKVETPKLPLYLRFARLDGADEDQCLRFAHAWGLLWTQKRLSYERLSDWQKAIRDFNGLLRALGADGKPPGGILRMRHGSRGTELPVANLKATLLKGTIDVDGVVGRPTLLYEPENLFQAINLQFGQYIATSGIVRFCEYCAKPFEVGGPGARRKVAVFCDRTCNDKFHNQKKAAAS